MIIFPNVVGIMTQSFYFYFWSMLGSVHQREEKLTPAAGERKKPTSKGSKVERAILQTDTGFGRNLADFYLDRTGGMAGLERLRCTCKILEYYMDRNSRGLVFGESALGKRLCKFSCLFMCLQLVKLVL